MTKFIPISGMEKMLYFNSWNPTAKRPYMLRFQYTLEDDIDPSLLTEAVRSVRKYFWPFRMMLVMHKGEFMYEEIDNEPPVFPFESRTYTLGTEETNGYMYYILHNENNMEFFFAHGVSDTTCFAYFAYFVVKYYCSLKYPEDKGFDIAAAYRNLNIWETHDPFDYLKKNKVRAPKDFMPKQGYIIPEGADYIHNDMICLDFPADSAMEVIKANGVSPVVYFTTLFNRALREVCGPDEKDINVTITLDIRRITGKNPLTAYSGCTTVEDSSGNDSLSFREHCARNQAAIASQDTAAYQNNVVSLSLYSAKVADLRLLPPAVRAGIIHNMHMIGTKINTYVATNAGRMQIPSDKVKCIDGFASGTESMYMLITSFRDVLEVKFLSFPGEKKVIDRFVELLGNEGLETEPYLKRFTEPTRLDISRLKRV